MSLFRPDTVRRREVRKSIPRKRVAIWVWLSRGQVLWGMVIVAVFVAVSSRIVLQARSGPPYQPGQLIDRAAVSRVAFKSLDLAATETARENARRTEPRVYVPNEPFFKEVETRLFALPIAVHSAGSYDQLAPDLKADFPALKQTEFGMLLQMQTDGQPTLQWKESVDGFVMRLRRSVVMVESEQHQIEMANASHVARIVGAGHDGKDLEVYDGDLINLGNTPRVEREVAGRVDMFLATVRPAVVSYIVTANQPTYRIDPAASETAAAKAAEAVKPVQRQYAPNDVLVPAGTQLGHDAFKLLREEHEAYLGSLGQWSWVAQRVGPFVLIVLLTLAIVTLVATMRPRIAENPMRGAAFAGLLLLTLLVSWLVRPVSEHGLAASAIAPAMLTAVILAIAYDRRFAVAVAAVHAMLIGLALRLPVSLLLVSIVALGAAVLQIREVRKRGVLVQMGLITGAVVFVGVFSAAASEANLIDPTPTGAAAAAATASAQNGVYHAILMQSTMAAAAVLSVGFFVLGVLPYIETAFKVTTSMTLLELGDMNHPLLRRLAQAAPGTFNHSLQVASLAEAGAEAIGANSLLCRVGAYYHDIGKIHKPQYFVENQSGGASKHDKLSPAMSLLIIVGHVKDGSEMAREYGLPPVVLHFIESHHGTTLVEYFYHAAKQQKGEGEPQPDEVEFRYPGPKPQTKEAAIMMVCDAVESACRSMNEPTATRIEQLVHKLTTKRLGDGQFNECDITLNELRLVEAAVAKTLTAIYHGRVAYPDAKEKDKDRGGEGRRGGAKQAV